MDFSTVKKWVIPEGEVLSVSDSNYNCLWEAPLQWDIEDGSTLKVTSLTDFYVNVINPNGEQFTITYPDWISFVEVDTSDLEVSAGASETSGYRDLNVNMLVGKCKLTFNPMRINLTTNKNFILKGPDGSVVSSATVTK